MPLQERGKPEFRPPPSTERARINDLINKIRCWERHIRIAQERGDIRQIEIGGNRLREVRGQIGNDSKRNSTI